ncbi:hypothetical protein [Flexivirga oryzae]|uniref:Uncharacterized protein n=1 Tax=Flexivirga oryzae TaxID=1794944 RepID=A0A839NCP4_9MICO|nr:hypothetical protein [Flexivirga oryzae]
MPFDEEADAGVDDVVDVAGALGVLVGEAAVVNAAADVARVVAATSPEPPLQPDAASTPSIATVTPIARVARMTGPSLCET